MATAGGLRAVHQKLLAAAALLKAPFLGGGPVSSATPPTP
jgi:hypothetical protein